MAYSALRRGSILGYSTRQTQVAVELLNYWGKFQRSVEQLDAKRLAKATNQNILDATLLREIIRKRFDTSGASSGRAWPPLKRETIEERQKRGYGGGRALIRSGKLLKAATGGPAYATERTIELRFGGGFDPDVAKLLEKVRPFYCPLGATERAKVRRAVEAATDQLNLRPGKRQPKLVLPV